MFLQLDRSCQKVNKGIRINAMHTWDLPVEHYRSYENYLATSKDNPAVITLVRPLCYIIYPRHSIVDLIDYEDAYICLTNDVRERVLGGNRKRFSLRYESFGGILYDRMFYRHYALNHLACDYLLYPDKVTLHASAMHEIELLLNLIELPANKYKDYIDIVGSSSKQNTNNLNAPFKVFFEISAKCSIDCVHCWYAKSFQENLVIEDIPTHKIIDALDQIYNCGVFEVNITGGEPFQHPDIFEILEFTADRFPGFTVSTSGIFLSRERIEKLARLNPRYLNISLDGTEHIHNEIRKGAKFESVVNNIALARNHVRDVGVSVTLSLLNYRFIRDIVEWACSKKIKKINWGIVKQSNYNDRLPDIILSGGQVEYILEKLELYENMYDMIFYLPTDIPRLKHFKINLDGPFGLNNGCAAGSISCKIRSNGKVIPCVYHESGQYAGSLLEEPFIECFNKFKGHLLSSALKKDCVPCVKHQNGCRGGCKGRTCFTVESNIERDPYCNINSVLVN